MRVIKWIFAILGALFVLLMLLWCVVVSFVATPEVLTPEVVKLAQGYSRGRVSIKSVDLTLLSSFPRVTLLVDSLRIEQEADSIADLLVAKRCRVAIRPFDLLRKRVTIDNIALHGASIYLYVDSLHSPSGNFIVEDAAPEEVSDTLDMSEFSQYTVTLNRVKIDSTKIIVDDRIKRFYSRIDNFGVDAKMDLSTKRSNVELKTELEKLLVWRDGELLTHGTKIGFGTKMLVDRDSMLIRFDRARVRLNGIGLRAKGTLQRDTVAGGIAVDMRSMLNTPSLAEFLNLIPASIVDNKEEITTSGEVKLLLHVNGLYSDTSVPNIDATLKIDSARAKYASRKLAFERVDCDAFAHVNLNEPKSSYVDIKNLSINASDIINLSLSGRVSDAIENPQVEALLDSKIDFDRFTELFPLEEGIVLKGVNESEIEAQFAVADIKNGDFANLQIDGESQFQNLELSLDASKFVQDTTSFSYIYMQAESGRLLFGNSVKSDNSKVRTLRSQVNFTGLGYKAKTGEFINIKDIELRAGANFDSVTKRVNGMGVRGIAQSTRVGVDSLFSAELQTSDILLVVVPKSEVQETKIVGKISSQHINVHEPTYSSDISLSSVDMDIDMQRIKLKKWSMAGEVAFSEFEMFSQLFPLEIRVPQTKVSVDNEMLYLNNTELTLGESRLTVTGNIKNLLRKLTVKPKALLSGELVIDAPVLDVDEFVAASNKSVLMQEGKSQEEILQSEADTLNTMFLVPKRTDFKFDLNIERAKMMGTTIESVDGHATIKRGVLSLDSLTLTAIGAQVRGDVVYRNIDSLNSNVMANLRLSRVDINRIGELLPTVESMLPMIESFEGLVDFDVKLNSNLDKSSMPDISTLTSAMSFKGENLVLMDGETFAEISKMLRFKNRERNLIDSLELFALVDESRVDVLPFSLSMDRYSFIVGGHQVIDPVDFGVDYNYNISIMKSPLPFKAGVDVTGDLEDFKYKITKAKLKKTDFEEQRRIYEAYNSSIDVTFSELHEQLDSERETARQKRRELRALLDEQQKGHGVEAEIVEAADSVAVVDSVESAEIVESVDSVESAEDVESTEVVEPADSVAVE